MKILQMIIIAVAAAVAVNVAAILWTDSAYGSRSPITDTKVLVHIMSSPTDDPSAVMAGIQKAAKAQEKGFDTLVVFDVHAGRVPFKSTNIQFGLFRPSQTIIKQLIDDGGLVYVCVECTGYEGDFSSLLLPGVKTINSDRLFSFLSSSNVAVFDY